MKKGTTISLKGFFILIALILIFDFNASHALAEFYVIAGSRGVGTEIKSLPYTISSAGFYYIKKDLSCAAGSNGITITADNATLDLMGFSLIGPGGGLDYHGIYMSERSNVEIRNGTVTNFPQSGIYEDDAYGTGHRIIDIRARDNGDRGIYLLGKNHIIERCSVIGNDNHGIQVSYGATITGNTCYDNVNDGINASDGSTINGNTCYDNNDNGISVGTGSTVIGNTSRDNDDYGISLGGDNLVDQNTATGNGLHKDISYCASCTFGANHAPDPEPAP